jgi:hypothetical protein
MASTCTEHGALEVVDVGFLKVLPGVDGVWFEAFEPGERCEFHHHREVIPLVVLEPLNTSMVVE